MEVIVRNNNVEKGLRVMKRKMKKEGLLLELKERAYYQKPSEKKRLAKKRGIKRALKLQKERNRLKHKRKIEYQFNY
jgi:small subunit ribosomal protein S21